jgi:hypothetical protein
LHGDIQQVVQTWLREQPKSFFFEGRRSLFNDTRSASLCRGTMSKSNMCICSPSVELKLLSKNFRYFLIHPHIILQQNKNLNKHVDVSMLQFSSPKASSIMKMLSRESGIHGICMHCHQYVKLMKDAPQLLGNDDMKSSLTVLFLFTSVQNVLDHLKCRIYLKIYQKRMLLKHIFKQWIFTDM